MKRYFAFYGQCCYPSPGMGDFLGDYDDQGLAEEAILAAEKSGDNNDFKFTWGHIWDSHTRSTVREF